MKPTPWSFTVRVAAPETEMDAGFVQGMANRMAISYVKYGDLPSNAGKVDFIASLRVRLQRYLDTGNTEWLMDVANLAMIEFMHPSVDGAHFKATDSEQEPVGRVMPDGTVSFGHINETEDG